MSSLTVHLRLLEDHSGLPFHASCPVCRRERLAGSLEGDEFVSRRTQAAIAVGLLAFSGIGGPAAAVAAGPDEEIDGTSEVVASPEPHADELDETVPVWIDGGAAPLEDDPAVVPETEDGSMEATPRETAEESLVEDAGGDPVVEPAPEPIALAAPPAEDPYATTEAPVSAAADGVRVDTAEPAKRERPVKRTKPAVQPRVIAAPAPVVASAATHGVTVRVTAGTNQNTISSGTRFHVIQRGESLWSIASDVLGDDASSAQVSREVSRLWELNQERIGTGSPDLVYAGTRLRLR
jgi:hypothetical protein